MIIQWPMSCERDFFTLKGEWFTFSNNLWSKNPFAKVEKSPFAKESRSDDMALYHLQDVKYGVHLQIEFENTVLSLIPEENPTISLGSVLK
jgi:hypothetical protein